MIIDTIIDTFEEEDITTEEELETEYHYLVGLEHRRHHQIRSNYADQLLANARLHQQVLDNLWTQFGGDINALMNPNPRSRPSAKEKKLIRAKVKAWSIIQKAIQESKS